MEWLTILFEIFKVCIIPLLGLLTGYVIKFIQAKEVEINNKIDNDQIEKYVTMLSVTVSDCVAATTQTYVDTMKKAGSFDVDAQKMAFQKTFDAVMGVLTEDAKEYLTTAYGDLNIYITNRIEAEVKAQK